MNKQLKIVEASLCFEVYNVPKTPINEITPFVIDTRGVDTERVVPINTDIEHIPHWILNNKKGYLKLVYTSKLQNIECTFKESALIFHGVKYVNLDKFCDPTQKHLDRIFSILDVAPAGTPVTMYKAIMVLDTGTMWDRDLIADIITNDPEISQIAAISERLSTLGNRNIFSVSITTENIECARITMRRDYSDNTKVTVTMSKLPNVDASTQVADIVINMFTIYRNTYNGYKVARYEKLQKSRLKGIVQLRNELPELFINNYTRECPILPIMVSQELIKDDQRVIQYPIDGPMSRFYTAPKGYFVGLKKNRLSNRDMFPCLVTCYLHDHMLRKGSETYMYYIGDERANKDKVYRPIPRSMGSLLGYDRIRVRSFINAIEVATGKSIDTESLPWCPQIAKQEMWDISDDDIMSIIRSTNCNTSTYRYFEELLGVSIHVVVIKSGMFEPLVAHRLQENEYIWAPPYSKHIVIFETIKKTYGETRILYDVLARDNSTVFDNNDSITMSIVHQKSTESVAPFEPLNAVQQLIDEKGKCRIIVTSEGKQIETFTRPLTVPLMPSPACFFNKHINKMNVLKSSMDLPIVELYKHSTSKVLYFPNNSSFSYWLKKRYDISP